MAESVVFSLACKLLSTIASPAFQKAYEKGLSIWEARDDLAKLQVTIETIQAMLLDAERKQESSVAVKNWIKRLKGVLYDAEDLFDEVVVDDMLKQQIMEGSSKFSMKKQVRVSCSKLNPIVSRDSIAKKVKAIRKSLGEISTDMVGLGFLSFDKEEEIPNSLRRGQDLGCFVDAKNVIGRDDDMKAIFQMLFDESGNANANVPAVISIVGIGGMGKTTLAQLIYNDDVVKGRFENRWFACISDTSDEREFLEKILDSICGGSYSNFRVGQLQTKIRESIEGKNFLLVLDDVWDDHRGRWEDRRSVLGGAAKGSKIIVTTRSLAVAKAVGSLKTQHLGGLSEDESWFLFKRVVAFTPEQENDPRYTNLGREIVKKCANVPLAIKSIGSLLFEKNTIQEWESIRDEELPKIGQRYEDGIMPVLKLSYDHLQSNLKHCFAYCSLFPKDYIFEKQKLIYLWIAQGYINQNNEDVGHSDFMYLLRRGFFQEAKEDAYGEIKSCKMHDLIHDLAQHVAGDESIMLRASYNISNCTRHASVESSKVDESWAIPASLLNATRLRSWLWLNSDSIRNPTLHVQLFANFNPTLHVQLFANFKFLRALCLKKSGIENVPSSIGELKHLRYLDLSENMFTSLPDSVTNLLNLVALEISRCNKLKALPNDLRKLINLRYLSTEGCWGWVHMPLGMGQMTCLQHLSDFRVGKASSKRSSGLDALARLVQLRGELRVTFEEGIEDWDGDEGWQLPVSLQSLKILYYPGKRIPDWGSNGRTVNNLVRLELWWCNEVTHLPPLRCLPYLEYLLLRNLLKLEFVEDGGSCTKVEGSSSFFPRLERLELKTLPKLKGWSSTSALLSFPLLSALIIIGCPELKSIPLCPRLRELRLVGMSEGEIEILLAMSPSDPAFSSLSFQEILTSPHLEDMFIFGFNNLEIMHLAQTKLKQLSIMYCQGLRRLHITHPNAIEKLSIVHCPQVELWESQDERSRRHLNWDSLTNLRELRLYPLPSREKIPQCLRHRQALGQLQIRDQRWP